MKKSNKINYFVRKGTNTIYLDYLLDGKRVQKSTFMKPTKHNLREVKQVIKIAKEEGNAFIAQHLQDMRNMTDQLTELELDLEDKFYAAKRVSQASANFIDEKKGRGVNADTYKRVISMFIEAVGDREVRNIRESDYNKFKDYLNKKELSYHSQQTYIKHLHIFFRWCIDNKHYDEKNPIIKMKEREKEHITIIPDEDMIQILDTIKDTPIYNYIRFLYYTAFRRNEAYQLKWKQIDFKQDIIKVITFKDHHREDTFPLNVSNGELRTMLKEMYKNKTTDYVFNLNLHSHTILKLLRKKTIHLNIPNYTLHDIRRTTISKWAAVMNHAELTALSRHRSVKTAMKYYINLDMKAIGLKI